MNSKNFKITLLIIICIVITILLFKISDANRSDIDNTHTPLYISDSLDENGIDNTRIFIDMNSFITMKHGDTNAFLNLNNPTYSAYYIQVIIGFSKDDILYKSDILSPGTSISYIDLGKILEIGTHELIAYYTVYNDNEGINIISDYQIKITLDVV